MERRKDIRKKANTFDKRLRTAWVWVCRLVGIALLLVYIGVFLRVRGEEKRRIENEELEKGMLDGRLSMDGYTLMLDSIIPLYRLIPVEGGEMGMFRYVFGNATPSEEKCYIRSFFIGQSLIDSRFAAYIMNGEVADDSVFGENRTESEWQIFIDRLNKKTGMSFRMPTSDEWEYAARGGQKSKGYIYAGGNNIHDVALCKGDTIIILNTVSPILKRKRPNELDLYDMSGGLWELTSTKKFDTSDAIYKALLGDKIKESYIARGGSFDTDSTQCRIDYNPLLRPDDDEKTGLRLVLDYE